MRRTRRSACWRGRQYLGGPWQPDQPGDRSHGLDIIAALAGSGHWGIDGDHAGRHVGAVRPGRRDRTVLRTVELDRGGFACAIGARGGPAGSVPGR